MIGRLIDITFGRNRKQRITIEVDRDFRAIFDRLKDQELDITIVKHREKRSNSANAYFHVLVNEIALELGVSDDSVKKSLVVDYGVIAKDENGLNIGFKVPAAVDVDTLYPYTRCFDTREEDGMLFKCYLVFKRTREMNTKEMARLIDGAIEKAQELGIETDTPEQIASYKKEWNEQ